MRRRDALAVIGGATIVSVSGVARTQKPPTAVVGFLCAGSAAQWNDRIVAFRKGLAETGYADGQNVAIEYRWAEGQYDRLPALATELVRRQVSALVAVGGTPAGLSAKKATAAIPIVFVLGSDPVALGLVASLSHPGGNVTGIAIRTLELEVKILSLLHELVPQATIAGILVNPDIRPITEGYIKATRELTRTIGTEFHILNAHTDREINDTFAALTNLHVGALVVAPDAFFETRRDHLIELAARQTIPTLYFAREFVLAGGLASYGADVADAYGQAGVYTGKILKGVKPSELPIVQSTKIEFVINLRTAQALGLTIPQSLRLRADELIQ